MTNSVETEYFLRMLPRTVDFVRIIYSLIVIGSVISMWISD